MTEQPAQNAQQPPPEPTAVQLALDAGWTMAVLYGNIPSPLDNTLPELLTVAQLPPQPRRELERGRLEHLLQRLGGQPELQGLNLPADVPDKEAGDPAFEALNLDTLTVLASARPEIQRAYELGSALRETVNPPADPHDLEAVERALVTQLTRPRIAKLQEWLKTLSAHFPQHAAAVVATSLGRWSELAAVTIEAGQPQLKQGGKADVASAMRDYLRPQGDLWRMVLTGERSTAGLLSPEGYVEATAAALHRSWVIIRRVIVHYWPVLSIIAAALSGILYLAIANLHGAAQVWTNIAAIGGSLGISAQTIKSRTALLVAEAERPVFAMAEEDVMAWAITTLPQFGLNPQGVRHLRQAGIAPPSKTLGRI